jgi:hypothetical protein
MIVQPMPRALYGPIGISGAKIWVHGGCCHGKRWQSRWRVGQWWPCWLLCVLCFLCFVLCLSSLLATNVVENRYPHKPNCQLLCNHNIKSTTKQPQFNDMYIILLV